MWDEAVGWVRKSCSPSGSAASRPQPASRALAPLRYFHKGQGPEAPWQTHRCNWKRLALCVSLRPQRFCLHVQRDSDLYAHLKSSHSISWPDVTGLLLHWSIGCRRPWEKGVEACLPRRIIHIWLRSSTRERERGKKRFQEPKKKPGATQSLRFVLFHKLQTALFMCDWFCERNCVIFVEENL